MRASFEQRTCRQYREAFRANRRHTKVSETPSRPSPPLLGLFRPCAPLSIHIHARNRIHTHAHTRTRTHTHTHTHTHTLNEVCLCVCVSECVACMGRGQRRGHVAGLSELTSPVETVPTQNPRCASCLPLCSLVPSFLCPFVPLFNLTRTFVQPHPKRMVCMLQAPSLSIPAPLLLVARSLPHTLSQSGARFKASDSLSPLPLGLSQPAATDDADYARALTFLLSFVRDDYWLGGGGGGGGKEGASSGKPPLPPVSAPPVSAPPIPPPPSGGWGGGGSGDGVLEAARGSQSPGAASHALQPGGAEGGGGEREERGRLQGMGQLNHFPTAYSRHDSFLAMQVRCWLPQAPHTRAPHTQAPHSH